MLQLFTLTAIEKIFNRIDINTFCHFFKVNNIDRNLNKLTSNNLTEVKYFFQTGNFSLLR